MAMREPPLQAARQSLDSKCATCQLHSSSGRTFFAELQLIEFGLQCIHILEIIEVKRLEIRRQLALEVLKVFVPAFPFALIFSLAKFCVFI